MADKILNSFDVWIGAQGWKSKLRLKSIDNISLKGIAGLRKLILELSMQGKLVRQSDGDEPGINLLTRIASAKEQLVKDGKIRKQEAFLKIRGEEMPFVLPKGWAFARLGDLMEMYNGRAFKESEWQHSGTPIIRIQNLNDPNAPFNYVSGDIDDKNQVENGTLLISWSGTPGTSFGAFIWNRGFAALNQHINKCLVFGNEFNLEFLKAAINSNLDHLILNAQGGVGLKHVTKGTLNNLILGIPPLSEQHRIVAKVDELMALCDELEQQETNHLKSHQLLVETLLGTLTQAKDAAEFQTAWATLAQHFDDLFITEDSIDQLKQTILQLAVMGKLVKQDPKDEPASMLLERIIKKKEKLVSEEKIKKEKPLPEIEFIQQPFSLPNGWAWERLINLCEVITKGSSPKWQGISYTEDESDVLFITSENVGSYKLLLNEKKFVETKFNEIEPRSILRKGDFLMNIVGGSIGRTASYDIDDIANINQAVCLIRAIPGFMNDSFLLHFFNSEVCISYMFDKQVDNARANLSMGNISKFVIPIPPISEQHRIVAKIEELFSLCDHLKERITESQKVVSQMADSILEQVV